MALSGTLGDFSLADILQLIGLQRKTGVLILKRPYEEVTVGFDTGRVVSAESSARGVEGKLGRLLIASGKLTEPRLEEALRVQKETLSRLGHVLYEKKWVDKATLQRQLHLQVTDTIYSLFRWRDGEYDFQPRERVEWDREFLDPIPAENLLMEGARMVDEWPIIERVIPSSRVILKPSRVAAQVMAGAEAQVRHGSIYEEDIDFGFIPSDPLQEKESLPRLAPREVHVLRWVDGRRAAAEIADLTDLGYFETFKVLARLVELRMLERVETIEEVAEQRARPGLSRVLESGAGARIAFCLVLGLAALGAVMALWDHLNFVVPTSRSVPAVLAPVASHRWLTSATGLDGLRRAATQAQMARLEQAMEVYYLDTASWPEQLTDLVDHRLVRRDSLSDPWGEPFSYQRFSWGYRLTQSASSSRSGVPLTRERKFSGLVQAMTSDAGRSAEPESVPAGEPPQ